MSEKLTRQQLRERDIRVFGDGAPELQDLDRIETYQIPPERQAQLDREYIKFLEAKNARIEKLCTEASAWLDRHGLQCACLANAKALLGQVQDALNQTQ